MNEIVNISGIEGFDKNGTVYLKLETVARGLGFTQNAASGNEVVRWERVRKYLADFGVPTSGDGKLPEFIPENIFYRLAMKAKNETAEKFQAFVADEVLPSIRKHGGYMAGQEELTDAELLANAMLVANRVIEDRERQIKELMEENKELEEDANYTRTILRNPGLVTTNQIAKDYGMSARTFNKLLHSMGIQYKQGKQWLLYSPYQSKGYTASKTYDFTHKDGRKDVGMLTMWTQRGRAFLYSALKDEGIVPEIEKVDLFD